MGTQSTPAGMPIEQVLGEYSFSFPSWRRSLIRCHQSPGQLPRSEARASYLFPNVPEYKTPTLSYETHPNELKFGKIQAFRGRILTCTNRALTGSRNTKTSSPAEVKNITLVRGINRSSSHDP